MKAKATAGNEFRLLVRALEKQDEHAGKIERRRQARAGEVPAKSRPRSRRRPAGPK